MNSKKYFITLAELIVPSDEVIAKLEHLVKLLKNTAKENKKVIILGNGGSAAIASHVSVNLSKSAGIRAINFNESTLITCLANDGSYVRWVREALKIYADPGDLVILISSSGESENMINAAEYCAASKINFVTFTGKKQANQLASKNLKALNFWVGSFATKHIEVVHQAWLLFCVDASIGQSEYSSKI